MQIAKELAGFSPAEAETLRKAIGKKIHSLMASLKEKFLAGCAASGTEAAVAQQLWKDMEQSQDYSFNKSHAACYALIAYRTAWLRANHPHEYMAALISSVMNTKDRVPFYVNACAEIGIEVLPPDLQRFAAVATAVSARSSPAQMRCASATRFPPSGGRAAYTGAPVAAASAAAPGAWSGWS